MRPQDVQDWLWREMEQPSFKWWAARARRERRLPAAPPAPVAPRCACPATAPGAAHHPAWHCPAPPVNSNLPPLRPALHAGARAAAMAGCCCPGRRLRCWTWQQLSTSIPPAGHLLSWRMGLPWMRMRLRSGCSSKSSVWMLAGPASLCLAAQRPCLHAWPGQAPPPPPIMPT